jgi:FtsP/CotA-like multicopper oxidase with cupredoxin domain
MNKSYSYRAKRLVLALVMLAAPMAQAATVPPPVAPNPLYPPGIGWNPVVDYTLPNFAQSPNIRKFVDKMPGVGASGCTMSIPAGTGTCNENNLGQYIPLAVADQTSYLGSDYYEIGLKQYQKQLHSDLPPTLVRGYYQKNGTDASLNYLGPLILAKRNTAVRFKFYNELGPSGTTGVNGGDLFLPVDTTIMGAGEGPVVGKFYTQNRSDIHLHGGLTPWISDGTPHQWITPAGDPAVAGAPDYQKGASFQNVPDMVTGSVVNGTAVPCIGGAKCFTASAGDGIGTYYYSNQQSGRLMFYHDHAYGITRLNVYGGVAAGYLLTDPVEEDLITGRNLSGGNPAATQILPDLGGVYHYGIPLIIQDKAFVNDATTPSAAATAAFPAPETGYLPTPKTLTTDPLWQYYVGTTGGNIWMGHEYMPVENPFDPTGNTPNGRWDYAPFMIPPMVPLNLTLPSPTIIPETFVDTALVNGTAYPYLELPPDAVRFRILNACNDRSLNLQMYKADPLRIHVTNGGSGYLAATPPVVTIAGGTGSYTSATATVSATGVVTAITVTGAVGYNPATPPTVTVAAPVTGTTATAAAFVATEVKMVDAVPNAAFPTWPKDGRDGGVPDPLTKGPDWLQIGNESGFLAQVAVTPAQPVDFNYNRQVIPLVGVTSKSLYLMPAMRADVVVDLTSYKDGDTLIVYNDAPAAMPNYWPINDYFTDDPDQTAVGGAPTTPAGFGPNTRTIMQIRIKGAKTSSFTFSKTALQTALPKAFAVTQDPIIVPQLAYNAAYPVGHPLHFNGKTDNYVQSYQTTMNLAGTPGGIAQIMTTAPGNNYPTAPRVVITGGGGTGAAATAGLNPIGAVTLLTSGAGYTSVPTVTLGAPNVAGSVQATAVATISGGIVNAITISEPGSGYTSAVTAPTCTITGGGATTAATCSVMLSTLNTVGSIRVTNPGTGYTSQPMVYLVPTTAGGVGAAAVARLTSDVAMTGKNLTEGFDVEYGRMDIRLGSTPNPLTPNVGNGFVLGIARYIDPPTEIFNAGETILWRLAHLGVDSHAMHFHLFNVQVVNRVDWTNVIKPPYPDEIGWRETIRTNPMEDIIVAIRPVAMTLPFRVPSSQRVLDPTTPLNSTTNFFPVPPPAGVPAVAQQSNVMTNFGWEYVWHCHLLGHEENDMMRPMVMNVPNSSVAPALLSFGNEAIGIPSAAKPATLSNPGAAPLLITGIAITGTNPGDFAQTNNCGTSLAAGASCAINVTFNPAALGARSASLAISTNDVISPLTVSLTGTGVTPVSITPPTLPAATVSVAYSQTLAATGAAAPYVWSLSAGALPTGLTLSSAGVIGGTPSAAGTFNFTVQVTAAGSTATQALSIVVNPAVSITTTTLPNAVVGVAYSQTLAATGDVTPYVWTLATGTLPAGLTLSSAGGISGTTTAAGTSNFTVRVTAAGGSTATRALSIVSAAFSITTATPLPGATLGTAYSQTLAASGAPTPYTWAVTTGTLPNGLTLSTAGVISGTPTAAGTFNFTVRVTATGGATATKALTITVSAQSTNIAPLATVTASTQNTGTGQTAVKAVDGVISGYPANTTAEWATTGQRTGAWLNLAWPTSHSVTRVVLYDRPNLNDQITSATLTFSDGSSLTVGPLNNNGTATTYTFAAKVITSLRMTVTGVSSATGAIGLSEIQVY